MANIRPLKAEEIEVRVGGITDNKGGFLLLYKDARCDMNILDETFTPFGWQRHHELIDGQLFCVISVYDEERKRWISKQDVGIESNTEEVKGRASDSFKRAGVNWGIGRELYTAPFIWIKDPKANKQNWKYKKFRVKEIDYDEKKVITHLVIEEKINYEWVKVFDTGGSSNNKNEQKTKVNDIKDKRATKEEITAMFDFAKMKNVDFEEIKRYMMDLMGKENSSDLTSSEIIELNEYIIAQAKFVS